MVLSLQKSPSKLLKPLIVDPLHWKLLEEYLAVEKDRLVTRLINCTEEELKLIQGEIKALDKLINLKVQLKAEEKSHKQG